MAGTIELLRTRATAKSQMRADVTAIRPRQNNPLKFSPDVVAPEPVRAAGVSPQPDVRASGDGLRYEGMTYSELLAKAPAKLAALKRENPDLYNTLRSAG